MTPLTPSEQDTCVSERLASSYPWSYETVRRLLLRVFQEGSILGLDIPVVADAAARSVEMLKILEKNMLMDGSWSGMTSSKMG
jgi:hypothetical protein